MPCYTVKEIVEESGQRSVVSLGENCNSSVTYFLSPRYKSEFPSARTVPTQGLVVNNHVQANARSSPPRTCGAGDWGRGGSVGLQLSA